MSSPITDKYKNLLLQYQDKLRQLNRQHNILTAARLLVALTGIYFLYQYISEARSYQLYIFLCAGALFFFLMNRSQKIAHNKQFYKNLVRINAEEITYLEGKGIPFENGQEFADRTHVYTADLDVFGKRSLFHHINRTATYAGQARLAGWLSGLLPVQEISVNQQSVAELRDNTNLRQQVLALARISGDNKDTYSKIREWALQQKEQKVNNWLRILAFALPLTLILCFILYWVLKEPLYRDMAYRLIPINLLVLATQLKHIRRAMFHADRINEVLKQYAAIVQVIERAPFSSRGLKALQEALQSGQEPASKHISRLSKICNDLASIQNPFGAVLLNALFLYHIHAWHRLIRWKKKYAAAIPGWIEVMGQWEAISSFANLADNNPEFAFPELNDQGRIYFEALGHPMIPRQQRVCNTVSFTEQSFIILTGSNMAGKSTFLRSLGINMILASAGSVVCASRAAVQPMPLLVSMRQSDSLADNESYFFAEVKKLKYIIQKARDQKSFVLLDEILRGTNSDDKRSGTIAVIKRIIQYEAIGVIATHDLEVCHTTEEHPDLLMNKCFEVEIVSDELVFDYKLRDGVCRNKSATFLMKKMDII